METSKLILALLLCYCLTACQWNLEEIELANAQITCLQNCVNGTCDSNYICECQTGWQGANCDTPITNTNFCDTTNCNNGTCNETLNKCDCTGGWMGEDCLTEVSNDTFEKIITNNDCALGGNLISETESNNYVLVSSKVGRSGLDYQIRIEMLNDNLESKLIQSFEGNRLGVPTHLIKGKDNYIILTSECLLLNTNSYYPTTTAIKESEYASIFQCTCLTNSFSSNNNFVIVGQEDRLLYPYEPYIVSYRQFLSWAIDISIGGEKNWERFYGEDNRSNNILNKIEMSSNSYYAIGATSDSSNGKQDFSYLEIDLGGKSLRTLTMEEQIMM